jgi:flagellar biosynthesis/type III secretory pathway protein FliH
MSTETVKKTKAPAKPKAVKTPEGETGSAVKAAPKAAAKTKAKAALKSKTVDIAASRTPSYEEIARLAERYWAERGWQDGYAEQDWLRAEQELLGVAS